MNIATDQTTIDERRAEKIKVLSGAHIRVTLHTWAQHLEYSPNLSDRERYAKELERAASDFYDFVRDHRHQDCTGVEVVREYEDVCSECRREWDPYFDTDSDPPVTRCVYCGVEVQR